MHNLTTVVYCHSVHRKDLKTIQQVVDEVAPKGDVEGYLQLTDYIIQQIKYAHLKEVSTSL